LVSRRRSWKSLAQRLVEVGPTGVWLLLRTFVLLAAARLALHLLPISRVIAWKQRGSKASTEASSTDLQRVRRAVLTVARYSPVRFVCFPQCLAACALLRSRSISSRLHYGVARSGDKLVTHTWLEAGGEIVIGGEVAGEYSTLAVY
jgi:hypothetical protein